MALERFVQAGAVCGTLLMPNLGLFSNTNFNHYLFNLYRYKIYFRFIYFSFISSLLINIARLTVYYVNLVGGVTILQVCVHQQPRS